MSSPRTFRIRKPSQLTLALAGSAVAVAAIAAGTAATALAGPAGTPGAPHSADAVAGSAGVAGQPAGTQASQPTPATPVSGTGHAARVRHAGPAAPVSVISPAGQASPAAPPSLSGPGRGGAALFTNAAASLPATPRRLARGMMPQFGWSAGGQFRYLDWLWMRESSWNRHAANPYSGAYGIPQAVPGSKMASAGPDWRSNAATQIRWGLSYIRGRYGSPRSAWNHELAYGWY